MDKKGVMILAKDKMYSMDGHKTKLNNNVLVVGASGSGKTRGIVSPNILMATGSYIISDPKGNLYRKYGKYLESMGYAVKKLDFTDPLNSAHYNFLSYIKEPKDILKAAHMIAYQETCTRDPFWDQASTMLLAAMISYCIEFLPPQEQNFKSIEKLLQLAKRNEYAGSSRTGLDVHMEHASQKYPDSFAVNQYNNVAVAPERTFNSILISLTAKLRNFSSEEITYMMSSDDVDISSIGQKKTALFVIVSDNDRSMDVLANLFFTQAINELCLFADTKCEDNELPVPVRFILDDFATNCIIGEFPRMISSIRSRGISTMLMIQSEAQLSQAYEFDKDTVIGNCDTYVYLGGSDIETARKISEKADIPLKKVLNMPVGNSIIFRRGQEPVFGKLLDLESFEKSIGYKKPEKSCEVKAESRSLKERLSGRKKRCKKPEPEKDISIRFDLGRGESIPMKTPLWMNNTRNSSENLSAKDTDKKDTSWIFN